MRRLLWKRKIIVEVAGLTISDPKISIDLRLDGSSEPPSGNVIIYNLAADTESRIHKRGTKIKIIAGYEPGKGRPATTGLLLDAAVLRVERTLESLTRQTKIAVTDQVSTSQGNYIELSYQTDTHIRVIARDIIRRMNRDVGNLELLPDISTNDWYWSGTASGGLRWFLSDYDLSWYEDGGAIHVSPKSRKTAQKAPSPGPGAGSVYHLSSD